jgi:hypothetical protein
MAGLHRNATINSVIQYNWIHEMKTATISNIMNGTSPFSRVMFRLSLAHNVLKMCNPTDPCRWSLVDSNLTIKKNRVHAHIPVPERRARWITSVLPPFEPADFNLLWSKWRTSPIQIAWSQNLV